MIWANDQPHHMGNHQPYIIAARGGHNGKKYPVTIDFGLRTSDFTFAHAAENPGYS